MKPSTDFVAPLLIPFLNLRNNTALHGNSLSLASTVTGSSFSPLQTHHHHHHDNHHRDEHHILRPVAGSPRFRTPVASTLESSTDCPTPPVVSCSAQAASTSSCCVVSPGGVLVHTQFWDLGIGQPDSWGIHGLWPDKCDGTYYEKCDSSRAYTGAQITSAIQNAGQTELLNYMNTYWLSDDETPEDFWSHEWEEHGTCVSTLEPSCFTNYVTAEEVVPYFSTVVAIFKQFDTYTALAGAGITPSSDQTYNLVDMQIAVQDAIGYTPDFICSSNTLTTVEYYLNAEGPLQDGSFVQSQASRNSECPTTGIEYPPKTVTSSNSDKMV